MEFELQNSKDGSKEVAESDDPYIRFYYTPKVSYVGDELFEAERGTSCTFPHQRSHEEHLFHLVKNETSAEEY